MWARKTRHYADHFEAMEQQNLRYMPMVISCYGRVHPESAVVLEHVAKQAARRLGWRDERLLLRRARASIGVAIWCRAANMARACLPKPSRDAIALLFAAPDWDDDV